MGEDLAEAMEMLVKVLYWLDRREDSYAVSLLSRLLRLKKITGVEEFRRWVESQENQEAKS